MIKFIEHNEPGYVARTIVNARSADLTIAFALDFTSAGERLTHKAAYGKYQAVDIFSTDPGKLLDEACEKMQRTKCKELNIAGNGIYSLRPFGTQEDINEFIYIFLDKLIFQWYGEPVGIRSGGQTGSDEAGALAGQALGLQTTVLAPKGWLFRDINGRDIADEAQFLKRFGPEYDVSDIL